MLPMESPERPVAKAPGRIGQALIRLLMKRATVTASERLADGFRLITLEGPALEGIAWTPGQKIQIVTAVDASGSPKQQFILTSPDGAGTGKVILASPETSSAKQLIFTTSDNLVPGRIQVRPIDRHLSQHFCSHAVLDSPLLFWRPAPSLEVLWGLRPWWVAALAQVKTSR